MSPLTKIQRFYFNLVKHGKYCNLSEHEIDCMFRQYDILCHRIDQKIYMKERNQGYVFNDKAVMYRDIPYEKEHLIDYLADAYCRCVGFDIYYYNELNIIWNDA